MNRFLTAVSATALLLTASVASAQDFRALAQTDLVAARDELRANHPAAVIPGAAGDTFRAWIDAGLTDAQGRIGQVNSGDAHAYLMRYYGAGFRDSNISIRPTFEGLGPYFGISWPGVATGWRNGRYEVTYVKPGVRNAPRVGDVVVSCNLTPIEEYARGKLDKWEGNLETESGRVTSAPYLLWNRNNPFVSGLPSTCEFQRGGRGRARAIDLRPIPLVAGDLEAAYRATVYMPPATPLNVETVNGRPWVHVHSFADSAGWSAFNSLVENQAAALRGPQGFVLDLRAAAGTSAFTSTARGYGLAFGHAERKAMAMALVDRALRADELGEAATSPAQDEEFVLAHSDNVEGSGFVQHLKLPHYVDFQSELVVVRMLRAEAEQRREQAALAQAAE
ncbi:MAG: hypothetical protein B7Z42_13925 [Brevundimonas sp. 12-68-7]|nr:MAG: hypothetical protein B7Z42_13925 [Brevundimonas sp. 12-68-7]